MGPTSRDDFPQKEQVVTRLPRNPCGLLGSFGGVPLPPPPLPVRRSLGIGWPSSSQGGRAPTPCKTMAAPRVCRAAKPIAASRVAPGTGMRVTTRLLAARRSPRSGHLSNINREGLDLEFRIPSSRLGVHLRQRTHTLERGRSAIPRSSAGLLIRRQYVKTRGLGSRT